MKDKIHSDDPENIEVAKEYMKSASKVKGSGVFKLKPNAKCPECGHEMYLYNHVNLPSLNK